PRSPPRSFVATGRSKESPMVAGASAAPAAADPPWRIGLLTVLEIPEPALGVAPPPMPAAPACITDCGVVGGASSCADFIASMHIHGSYLNNRISPASGDTMLAIGPTPGIAPSAPSPGDKRLIGSNPFFGAVGNGPGVSEGNPPLGMGVVGIPPLSPSPPLFGYPAFMHTTHLTNKPKSRTSTNSLQRYAPELPPQDCWRRPASPADSWQSGPACWRRRPGHGSR